MNEPIGAMVHIRYRNETLEIGAEESLLDGLLRRGAAIPHGCRSGFCHACLMQATAGRPPETAQEGLSETLRLQNFFLPCVCHPDEELTVALPSEAAAVTIPATVRSLDPLNEEILRLALEPHRPLTYRPGQFINLYRDPELGRSYSLASLPSVDEYLHLHVRHLPGGQVSGWVHETLKAGQRVELSGPAGDCFYVPGRPEQSLLLIGTGTGLAPLYGIIRDALSRGHFGPIHLFHGSRDVRGLYLTHELRELTREFPGFDYRPCLSGPDVPPGHARGRVTEVAFSELPELKGWRIFLCGHPEMVQQAQIRAFLAGAASSEILTDPFNVSATPHP